MNLDSRLQRLEEKRGRSAIQALTDEDLARCLEILHSDDAGRRMGELCTLLGEGRLKAILAEVDGKTRGLPSEHYRAMQ